MREDRVKGLYCRTNREGDTAVVECLGLVVFLGGRGACSVGSGKLGVADDFISWPKLEWPCFGVCQLFGLLVGYLVLRGGLVSLVGWQVG